MDQKFIVETNFGRLILDTESNELREIAFKGAALTVSDAIIREIYYAQQELPIPPLLLLPFENYLLSGPHSFKREDIKEFVDKFEISNISSFFVSFSPDNSPISFAVSSSGNDEKEFELVIWDEKSDDTGEGKSWYIKVEDDEDIFVKALEYICLVAGKIHTGKIKQFIAKMDLLTQL